MCLEFSRDYTAGSIRVLELDSPSAEPRSSVWAAKSGLSPTAVQAQYSSSLFLRMSLLTNRKTKILLVEDNPGDVLLIREALRSNGVDFEIEHYETAAAGVRSVRAYQDGRSTPPDLILLDYNLPGGTARDVLRAIDDHPAFSRA